MPINHQRQLALRHAAERWLAQDPDDTTCVELNAILTAAGEPTSVQDDITPETPGEAAAAWRELEDRFGTRLAFGTAGLRGRQGAGTNRMNRVLVAQAARGFADYLLARAEREGTGQPSIVIGYDARINSERYARDTAELMQAAGVQATLLPRLLPTPVLAFAVRELGASAGVMVTASHNPKWDNGYKVYLGGTDGGSQIVSPADAEIAACIDRVANEELVNELPRSNDYQLAPESIIDAYVAATARVFQGTVQPLKIVYTPMHGVGWETFQKVLTTLGIPDPIVVDEQIEPDGSFPTVDFPNPEEPGALDLAFAAAERTSADIVIAHDPDADRLAVALRNSDGAWERLGGNDIGKLLGWRTAKHLEARGETTGATLATSLVSSPALSKVAAAYGLGYAETLTGFKWISRAEGIVYGYEEALGYLVNPESVHDKDGISASVAILEMAMQLAAEGRTIRDLDAEFAERFGSFVSVQKSVRFEQVSDIPVVMTKLRGALPTVLEGVTVTSAEEIDKDIIRLRLADGTRVMVRPSGTEPKIKCYVDAVGMEGTAAERSATARAASSRAANAMAEALIKLS
ncbi:phospho-sugar mutase [Pseudoclavibacter alba]|uniref:Phospho-sugar mutase n=1 Tax=Pseudoclavibacter albus TaxID=272241 RepID=A0ABT2HU08_9MICO|nr:phospho-sugar mutase [Pseudoclavibacter alba]MCT2041800.1 phospho-sugar mutase [Pseudoclavibacter alba]